MNSPFLSFDTKSLIKELGDFNTKLIKGMGSLTEIDEIDVGTAAKELIYTEDKLSLYRYSRNDTPTCHTPVLIVYALVNRQYMLDLQPDRSMIRNLLNLGLDVFIIDWGYPNKADMYLTLDDYINGYIDTCVGVVKKVAHSERVNLMGICQGGTFSAIYSALHSQNIQNLVTLVAPFDFSTNEGLLFNWSKHLNVDALVDSYRVVPGDFLNNGFLMMMPFNLNIRKYVDMLDVMEDKSKLLNFLRMEKWIFDSPGQAGECMRQFIKDCYQENKLVKGELKLGEAVVNLANITMPLLNIYASSDHLVPPAATKPLNDLVGTEDKTLYEFKGGHIGVFVGTKSQKELAPAIAQWLHERDGTAPMPTLATAVEVSADVSPADVASPVVIPGSAKKKTVRKKG
jgi:polyhydroxyalkanoate synthase